MAGKADFYPDGTDFVHDSYFCKWGYVANMDNRRLEILRGDQTKVPSQKLYGMSNGTLNPAGAIHTDPFGEYFHCRIVKSYSFDELPSDSRFLSDLRVLQADPHAGLESQGSLNTSDYKI
ncbi:hypothetical protein P4B35_10085 [Pontiellaceae bacterium B12227]|nr:hypothetical protein [Pontiellaceae bacterium B12227]